VRVARLPLRIALLVAALASVAVPGRARAAGSDASRVREARAHYEQAVSYYNLDEFTPALAEFREAYRLKPDPSFLFNIAQCHRKLGENDQALDYYRKYLRNLPDAPNRADVERIVAELRAKVPNATPTEVAPPSAQPAAPPPAPAPTPALDAPAPAPEASLVTTTPAPPAAAAPVYERWWFWTAVGAVVVAAVVVGVVASSKGPQPYAGNLGPNLQLELR
jgi:tetratricopeptide (TPR) repeat protein